MGKRPRFSLLWGILVVFTALGLSKFAYLWLDDLARQHPGTLLPRLIEEMTGAYAGALVVLGLVRLVERWPLDRERWRQRLPGYAAVVVVAGLVHTTLMWGSRVALFPLFGLGRYDYGLMRFRYPMEFALQAPNLVILLALLHAWRWYRGNREREVRAAQLESELNRVRLERLEAQLQPHFLFNALNAVSSLMYQDPARADVMLGRLSDLLRLTFDGAASAEVALAQELEWLGWYLEIMQLRFGDRLTVTERVSPETLGLMVPRLLLQPLVENALKHGPAKRAGPALVEIRAERRGDRLHLAVVDDGPGLADSSAALRNGVGVANTVERLQALYGERAEFTLTNRPEGGLEAGIDLPARTR